MSENEVFIVCPKSQAYEYKNIYKQSAISNAVTKWYEYYKGLGCTVCCYAEDMLAVELLYDKEVKWYTVLGSADRLFLQDNVTSYPEAYKKIQKNSIDTKIIRKSIIKYASKTLEQCVDMEMYLASNFNTLINRIRFAASDNLDVNAKAIVYVDTAVANRFCNLPKNVVGNGKSIVHVQVENNIELFSFGGIEMNHDSFIDVERCLYGSNV